MYTNFAKSWYVTASEARKRTKFTYLKEVYSGPTSLFEAVRHGISELAVKPPDTSTNPPTNRLELTFGKILQLAFGALMRNLSNEVKSYNRC